MKETATIFTSEGNIVMELDSEGAPLHVANFIKLVNDGFYDDMFFHRNVRGFLIQTGDPNTKPNVRQFENDSGYTLPSEIIPEAKHVRGSVNAARQDDEHNPKRESSGSQFCIFVSEAPHLDGKYTIFGKVINGMEVADRILAKPTDQNSFPLEPVRIKIKIGNHT